MTHSAARLIRLRTAGALSMLDGLGFGIPGAYGAWHFATTGTIWTLLGFPTYGGGPFERVGIQTTVALLVTFVIVCIAEVVCGVLLLRARRAGVVMSILLLPFELAFWIGFLLPYAFPIGIARTVLAAWPSRRS